MENTTPSTDNTTTVAAVEATGKATTSAAVPTPAVQVRIQACPGWATRVETLRLDEPDFVEEARRHLAPLLAAGVDQIVLGCTHYAFLCPVLEPIVGSQATLVDVADAVARQCVRLAGEAAQGRSELSLLATADPARLQAALPALGLTWLGTRLSSAPCLVVA